MIGINDDVTHTSLDYGAEFDCMPPGTKQCVFWGFGTDGTVGANKQAIKTIGTQTPLWGQGHFAYDSHKGGGVTMSHLRFGPEPIKGEYEIQTNADYIACHNSTYVHKFNMLKPIKEGGTFVLNWGWGEDQLDARLPNKMKEQIATNNLNFYTIDASKIALEAGLGQRVNMVLQAVFYHLSEVLPAEEAMDILKQDIEKTYGKKGPKIVQMNKDCVDQAITNLKKYDYPANWASATSEAAYEESRGYGVLHQADQYKTVEDRFNEDNRFVEDIMHPVTALEGDSLPVSAFTPGGYMPSGTTAYEKRGIATEVPVWIPDTCTQCNYCTIVCPHAVIRPFLFDQKELANQPDGFETRKAQGGAELGGLNYSIQLATMDCTGCEVCVKSCPDDSLYMAPFHEAAEGQIEGWDFSMSVPNKGHKADKFTVKGSQFQEPLMEFSGACSGCGETPYVKLLTQLYGDRLMIANASGCSSVWGGTSTTNPYSTLSESHDHAGRGPAWGRSLFEDNAEFGLGMHLATLQRRRQVQSHVENALEDESITMSAGLQKAFTGWLGNYSNRDKQSVYADQIMEILPEEAAGQPLLEHINRSTDLIPPISNWLIGGDGWAYDIGFGGLDHVLAKGENVNIMILDTEMYSNTGGQVSKSTAQSAAVKFASGGKQTAKKDMGQIAMMYENVYVASIAMGANYKQSLDAIKEAEEYEGPSLLMAYSPCIDWGIDMSNMMGVQQAAVDAGYWPLYRYDPRKVAKGEPPFTLDSKRIKADLAEFLSTENRFGNLMRAKPDAAKHLQGELGDGIQRRLNRMKRASMDDFELLDTLKKAVGEEASGDKITVLFASETGNTADLANMVAYELKRRNVRTSVMSYDDFDLSELPEAGTVINLVATCGQGEWPGNSKGFWAEIQEDGAPDLSEIKIATFAMGDSGYVFYNECGTLMHERMVALGAQEIMPVGMGDDQDEDKWETAWEDWAPELWNELGTDKPAAELLPASHLVKVTAAEEATAAPDSEFVMPQDAGGEGVFCPLVEATPLTPLGRDVRHFSWDITDTGLSYGVGDALGIWSTNQTDRVSDFLDWYGLKLDDVVEVKDIAETRNPPLPEVMTAQQLFCQVLDIFGRPKRQFYETLAILASDDKEKAQLNHLLEKEGRGELRELIDDTKTYADLLQMFPSAEMPLEYVIDFVPAIKPRLYSIASAPEMYPNHIHLCIVEEDWENGAGDQKRGQSTWHMRNLSPGMVWGTQAAQHGDRPVQPWTSGVEQYGICGNDAEFGKKDGWQEITEAEHPGNYGVADGSPFSIPRDEACQAPVRVNPSVVHPPPADVPLVVAGLGTGIAPFRAFIQQREIWREEGQDVGDILLYFGARYEKTEFLYGDEMYAWEKDGLVTEMRTAFSRDQEEKIYAQHRIAQDPELFYDYMVTRGGYFVSGQHSSFQSGCRSADLCGVHFAVPLRTGRQHAGADGGSGCERHCHGRQHVTRGGAGHGHGVEGEHSRLPLASTAAWGSSDRRLFCLRRLSAGTTWRCGDSLKLKKNVALPVFLPFTPKRKPCHRRPRPAPPQS